MNRVGLNIRQHMFGVSFPELIVVFAVALLVFGPERLPEIARKLGGFMHQFRRQSDAVRREFYNAVYLPSEEFKHRVDREARSLISQDQRTPTNCESERKTDRPEENNSAPETDSK